VYQGIGCPVGDAALDRKLLNQWPVCRVKCNGVSTAVAPARIDRAIGVGRYSRTHENIV
jgi:hypothetical protein